MEIKEVQETLAYLLGRGIAAEKALQTLIGSPQPNASLSQLLKTNLTMRRQQLPSDLELAGLPAELLPVASAAFVSQERAVSRGLQGGRYVTPGWRER